MSTGLLVLTTARPHLTPHQRQIVSAWQARNRLRRYLVKRGKSECDAKRIARFFYGVPVSPTSADGGVPPGDTIRTGDGVNLSPVFSR